MITNALKMLKFVEVLLYNSDSSSCSSSLTMKPTCVVGMTIILRYTVQCTSNSFMLFEFFSLGGDYLGVRKGAY